MHIRIGLLDWMLFSTLTVVMALIFTVAYAEVLTPRTGNTALYGAAERASLATQS